MHKPDWYWLPLLALFSGCRLGELGTLELNSFEEDSGFKLFHPVGKTGRRTTTIHSALLELGLWEYVGFLRSKGEAHFVCLRPEDHSHRSAGEQWGKYVKRCGITVPNKVFHSFRSTVITLMHDAEAPNPKAIRSAVGDSGGLEGVHGGYVRGDKLKLIHDAVESLTYPTIDRAALRLADPTFSAVYEKEKPYRTSEKYLKQRERRKAYAKKVAQGKVKPAQSRTVRTTVMRTTPQRSRTHEPRLSLGCRQALSGWIADSWLAAGPESS